MLLTLHDGLARSSCSGAHLVGATRLYPNHGQKHTSACTCEKEPAALSWQPSTWCDVTSASSGAQPAAPIRET